MGALEGATPIQSLLVNYSEAAAAALEVAASTNTHHAANAVEMMLSTSPAIAHPLPVPFLAALAMPTPPRMMPTIPGTIAN